MYYQFFFETLPFWVKKRCKKCDEKLICQRKKVKKLATGYSNMGKTVKNAYPFTITIIYSEYICPKCKIIYSMDDLLGREPRQWYTEYKSENENMLGD